MTTAKCGVTAEFLKMSLVDRNSLPYHRGGLQINVIIRVQLGEEVQLQWGQYEGVCCNTERENSSTFKYEKVHSIALAAGSCAHDQWSSKHRRQEKQPTTRNSEFKFRYTQDISFTYIFDTKFCILNSLMLAKH